MAATEPIIAIDHPEDDSPPVLTEPAETIFTVLADRARERPVRHLQVAAVLGAADFVALAVVHPALWPVAVGSLAMSAFGVWGLADRSLDGDPSSRIAIRALLAVRASAAVVGTLAAVAALLGIIEAALRGWIH